MATFPPLTDRSTGYVVPATEWNGLLGATGGLEYVREGFERLLTNATANGALIAGAVVVLDTATPSQVILTTTAADARRVYCAQAAVAAGALGPFRTAGVSPVLTTGTVNVGDRLCTATTAGRARTATGSEAGFARALTAAVSGACLAVFDSSTAAGGGAVGAGSITATELATDAVTAVKIAPGALTAADFETFGAGLVLAGPPSGASATPTVRALGPTDLPIWPYCMIYSTTDQAYTHNVRAQQGFDTEESDYSLVPMHYPSNAALTGSVSKTAAATGLTGSGTNFPGELSVGQVISVPGTTAEQRTVTAIASTTSLTVNKAWAATASGQTATRVRDVLALPFAGIWRVEGQALWANNATGIRTMQLWRNGSGGGGELLTDFSWPALAVAVTLTPSAVWIERQFDLWDSVGLYAQQTSGAGLSTLGQGATGAKLPLLLASYRGRV